MTNKSLTQETIYALASATGRAGVAVFRVSGPMAARVLESLCLGEPVPPPREAVLHKIYNPKTKVLVDEGIVLRFAAPASFTGEHVVEFHLHGGRAVLKAFIDALGALPFPVRQANPGEFTRRGFENGKMDLTEAEAVADLVDAETEAQRRQALRQLDGALGKVYSDWAERLKRSLAHSEAAIDFAEDELPPDLADRAKAELLKLRDEMAAHLSDNRRGERLREGFEVAILGAPNTGKSSLLNLLSEREAAIVSPIAGTTRDVIEVSLDLGGYPVTLADTAGLRESVDAIESEGVRRALARAQQADLKILLFDGATYPHKDATTTALQTDNALVVISKADLIPADKRAEDEDALFLSTETGEGVKQLLARLVTEIDKRFSVSTAPALTRARHRAALQESEQSLSRALLAPEEALRAEDVRLAMRALGRITGRVDVEDLLDMIFRDFCIGK